jgi:PKD repeat protein
MKAGRKTVPSPSRRLKVRGVNLASQTIKLSLEDMKNNLLLRLAKTIGMVAFLATESAFGQNVNQITAISPATAAQGTSGLTVTFTLDTDSPPAPPAGNLPTSVMLGTNVGTSVTHTNQYALTAQFNIPPFEPLGYKSASVAFTTPNGTLTYGISSGFQVTAGPGLGADFSATPSSGTVPLTVAFTNSSLGSFASQLWSFGDGATSTAANPSHTYTNPGSFSVSLTVFGASGSNMLTRAYSVTVSGVPSAGGYVVVDTAQTRCYNESTSITAPAAGQPFYGQDAQISGAQPSYTLSGDGLTVYDNRTGLTWQRSPDAGDGVLTTDDKLNWSGAQARPAALNAARFGGFSDWRLPNIKELYSLIDFRGVDPSGLVGTNTSTLRPFIDTNYFQFVYGGSSSAIGERIIDSQYASSTLYASPDLSGDGGKLFGVNFADGRIKGYGLVNNGLDKTFFVQCVRGNASYGLNLFADNGNQTVTDKATGLMWAKSDSGTGMGWSNALAWVQAKNSARYLGYSDWRLPNIKELQSIVDYTRSPDGTGSAALAPIFNCTQFTNENGQVDYAWCWSGTTHATYTGSGQEAGYVAFGRGLGYMSGAWVDVHGAGCQRCDPKPANLSAFTYVASGYYNSNAPQGDAVRIFNYVRPVRTALITDDSVGDGIPNAWRAQYFGGTGTSTNSISCATCDPDHDSVSNYQEYIADTNPTNALSFFRIQIIRNSSGTSISFQSSANRTYTLQARSNLTSGVWSSVSGQSNISGDGSMMTLTNLPSPGPQRLFRIAVQVP